jgi:MFS family permease
VKPLMARSRSRTSIPAPTPRSTPFLLPEESGETRQPFSAAACEVLGGQGVGQGLETLGRGAAQEGIRALLKVDALLARAVGHPMMLIETDPDGERQIGAHPHKHPAPAAVVDIEVVLHDPTLGDLKVPSVRLLVADCRHDPRRFSGSEDNDDLIRHGALEVGLDKFIAASLWCIGGLAVMATARGASGLIVSGVLVGIALSCTASSLVMTACARAVSEKSRSKVLGIVSAAGSLGTLMIPITTQSILAHHAWQIGALFFVFLAIGMLPAGFLAGGADRISSRVGAKMTMRAVLGQAARHRPFLVMSAAYFVCGLNLVFLTTHLPTYLAICGQGPILSAEAIAVIGGMNSIGSLTAGWLGSKYPKHILLGVLYILRAFVFTAYFVLPPTPTSTLLFAAAMGMLWLGVAPLISGLVAEMFGTRYMATLLGIAFVMHQVGSSLGAWGGGVIFDRFGSYDLAWHIGVLIGFGAGLIQILADGPSGGRDRIITQQLAPT